MTDKLILGGHEFNSRFILGSGKYSLELINAAVKNGATVINLPDTVGYTTPDEMRKLIEDVMAGVENSDKVEFSVHCHNDLGMAVANSLECVRAGATQVLVGKVEDLLVVGVGVNGVHVAALDADEGHAIVARGFRNRHDGGVHARRISAGSQNTNTTHKRIRLLIKWMEKRAHARKSARHASETRWQNPNLALLYAVWRDKVKTGENRKRAVKKMNRN